MKEFAGRLNDILFEKQMTNKALAEKAGMRPQNLNDIKRVGNPEYKTIKKLSKALGINPGLFFCS